MQYLPEIGFVYTLVINFIIPQNVPTLPITISPLDGSQIVKFIENSNLIPTYYYFFICQAFQRKVGSTN